eukprot:scaffold235394_cov31-Tisochrysis_lutea.AAC.3
MENHGQPIDATYAVGGTADGPWAGVGAIAEGNGFGRTFQPFLTSIEKVFPLKVAVFLPPL